MQSRADDSRRGDGRRDDCDQGVQRSRAVGRGLVATGVAKESNILAAGRWQECLVGLEDLSTEATPSAWFYGPAYTDADRLSEISAAATAIQALVSTWSTETPCLPCDAAQPNCEHKARSVVLAVGLWFAVLSRNGAVLESLLAAHDAIEEAHLACRPPVSGGDKDDDKAARKVEHARLSNAADRAHALVTAATGVRPHTFLYHRVKDVIEVCFGCEPGEPHVTLAVDAIGLDDPCPSELALRRAGAHALDLLALVVSDVLCEKRYARCLGEVEQRHKARGIALPILCRDARPDLLDMERTVAACDAIWHLNANIEIAAMCAEPPPPPPPSAGACDDHGVDGGDDDTLADCLAHADAFACWASMPASRASVCHTFMRRQMSLGADGAVEAACRLARDSSLVQKVDSVDSSARRDREPIEAFSSLASHVVECVTAAIWHAAQSPERGEQGMLCAALERRVDMGQAWHSRAWPLVTEAILARGGGSAAAAFEMMRLDSHHVTSLVFEALSMPHLWDDEATTGSDGDDKKDDLDIPPLSFLVCLAHAHPDVALNVAHVRAMARILAALRTRCDDDISGDSDDDDDDDDTDTSDSDENDIGENGAGKRNGDGHNVFTVKGRTDDSPLLRFDVPLWVAATECLLFTSEDHYRAPWLREVFLKPQTAQARAFAGALCRAHDGGAIVLDPPSQKEFLARFASGDMDFLQLGGQGPCKEVYIETL